MKNLVFLGQSTFEVDKTTKNHAIAGFKKIYLVPDLQPLGVRHGDVVEATVTATALTTVGIFEFLFGGGDIYSVHLKLNHKIAIFMPRYARIIELVGAGNWNREDARCQIHCFADVVVLSVVIKYAILQCFK